MAGRHIVLTLLGSKWKFHVSFAGEVMWTPFQARFGQLLERLNRHKALFRQEVKLRDSKMIDTIQKSLDIYYESLQRSLDRAYSRVGAIAESQLPDILQKHIGTYDPY